ncbi:hypothetical protein D030_4789 [Vibrio parahaemolyticus AQ3810]|nr:hypothetical protein D030_4789 [Vibrio parahaemolyticus AQ3810]
MKKKQLANNHFPSILISVTKLLLNAPRIKENRNIWVPSSVIFWGNPHAI